MSVSRQAFVKGNFEKKTKNRKNHPILVFLEKNRDRAYNVAEIKKAVKMNENTIRSMMGKLIKEGLVEHKRPYYLARTKKK